MAPYVAEMPSEVLSDFEQLKDLGLLQATKIYDLMYGWKGRASDTGGTSVIFQVHLFEKLTTFVCMQDL